jgi:hypothetical protein
VLVLLGGEGKIVLKRLHNSNYSPRAGTAQEYASIQVIRPLPGPPGLELAIAPGVLLAVGGAKQNKRATRYYINYSPSGENQVTGSRREISRQADSIAISRTTPG